MLISDRIRAIREALSAYYYLPDKETFFALFAMAGFFRAIL